MRVSSKMVAAPACEQYPNERGDPEPVQLPVTPPADHPHATLVEMIKRRRMEDYVFTLAEYENPTGDDAEDGSPRSSDYEHTRFSGRQVLDGAAWNFTIGPRLRTDVGLNSRVVAPSGLASHIGMIDFAVDPAGPPPFARPLRRALQWYPAVGDGPIALFATGRSIHAYLDPAGADKYVERMATLLLLNSRAERIVDDRWVAHKLIEGSAVLRWTANQRRYLAVPTLWTPPEQTLFWG